MQTIESTSCIIAQCSFNRWKIKTNFSIYFVTGTLKWLHWHIAVAIPVVMWLVPQSKNKTLIRFLIPARHFLRLISISFFSLSCLAIMTNRNGSECLDLFKGRWCWGMEAECWLLMSWWKPSPPNLYPSIFSTLGIKLWSLKGGSFSLQKPCLPPTQQPYQSSWGTPLFLSIYRSSMTRVQLSSTERSNSI